MSNIFTRIFKRRPAVNPKQQIVTYRVMRTVSTRKIARQILKNKQGNNRIGKAWREQQIKQFPSLAKAYALVDKWSGTRFAKEQVIYIAGALQGRYGYVR